MYTVKESQTHGPLSIVASSETIAASWNSIWDEALDFGVRGTRLMRAFLEPSPLQHSAIGHAVTVMLPSLVLTQTIYFPITSLITITTWLLGGWKARTSKIYSSWQRILHPLTFHHVHIHESLAHSLINIILYLLSPASLFYVPGGLYIA